MLVAIYPSSSSSCDASTISCAHGKKETLTCEGDLSQAQEDHSEDVCRIHCEILWTDVMEEYALLMEDNSDATKRAVLQKSYVRSRVWC